MGYEGISVYMAFVKPAEPASLHSSLTPAMMGHTGHAHLPLQRITPANLFISILLQ